MGGLGHGGDSADQPKRVERLVEMGEEIVDVACGEQHTLALSASGIVYAWGKGEFGRLGMGDTADAPEPEEVEYFRESFGDSGKRIVGISAGAQWNAARDSDGLLYVWGRNDQGQLGLGEESMGDVYSSERYPRLIGMLAAENIKMDMHNCGSAHMLAIARNGAVYSWGMRTWLEPRALTVPCGPPDAPYANSLDGVASIHSGLEYSFIRTEQGLAYVLGRKSSGCLGQTDAKDAVVPRLLPPTLFGREKIVDLAAGKTRCLAVTDPDVLVATSEADAEQLEAQVKASDAPDRRVELVTAKNFE
jgi:alpha-tubulin suppressor-like RCC1 family protein